MKCSCWSNYPNPRCKEKCLKNYVLVENVHKSKVGNKYIKTKCKGKNEVK